MQISFYGYIDVDRPTLKKLARRHKLAIRDDESADTYAVRLFNHILDGGASLDENNYWADGAHVEISNWEIDESTDYGDEITGAAQW
tara:strand:+ start:1355 stop:1615 length:261 start_codon:yes stop_codon:yes gene_type:complete